MTCEVKNNIKGYAALSANVQKSELSKAVLDGDQVIVLLKDEAALIADPNAKEVAKDNRELAKALNRIDGFKDFGMVIVKGSNKVVAAANSFLTRVITDKNQENLAVKAIARTTVNLDENGLSKNKASSEEINRAIVRVMSTVLTNIEGKTYVTQKNGELVISKDFTKDYNDFVYAGYMSDIGSLASHALSRTLIPEEIEDEILKMTSSPVVALIDARIRTLHARLASLKSDNKLTSVEESKLYAEREKLIKEKEVVKDKLNPLKLNIFIDNILDDTNYTLNHAKHVTPEKLNDLTDALNMVINAAEYSTDNRILSLDDQMNTHLMDDMNDHRKRASKMLSQLKKLSVATMENLIKDSGIDTKDGDILKIGGIEGWFRDLMSNVLGPHHINNATITFLIKKLGMQEVKSYRRARQLNDRLGELYDKINPGDEALLYQRNEKGFITSRMVDEFSEVYWKTQAKLKKKFATRRQNFIEINPEILFTDKYPDLKKRFEARLLKEGGTRIYDRLIAEAREKWDAYLVAKEQFLSTNPSNSDKKLWELQNSPVARLKQLGSGKVRKGQYSSDRFLVSMPRRTTIGGASTKFYDKAFEEVVNNPSLYAFYLEVRKANVRQQMSLHKYEELHKPPKLGFINKTSLELARAGKVSEAVALQATNFNKKYGRENLVRKNTPISEISGEAAPVITTQLHSLYNEINRRKYKLLLDNKQYINLKLEERTPAITAAIRAFEEEAQDIAAAEAEELQTDDLMLAVSLANYDTEALIEKKEMEAQILLASRLLKNYGYTDTDKHDKGRQKTKALEIVDHMLDMKFYGARDKESGLSLNLLKIDRKLEGKELEGDTKGTTDRTLLGGAITAARTLMLGWNTTSGARNLGQGAAANVVKAREGHNFDAEDLAFGYKQLYTKKARKLIEYLFVIGDVAHLHDRKSLHGENSGWSKAKPMYLTTRIEQINQGAPTIAILNKIQLVNNKGEYSSLYDALSDEGELSDEWVWEERPHLIGEDLIAEVVVTKIRPSNMEAHGDFLSSLLLDRSDLGKSVTMMTKYVFEMHTDLFKLRHFDALQDRYKEGRMISLLKNTVAFLVNDSISVVPRNSKLYESLSIFTENNDEITKAGARSALTQIMLVISFQLTAWGLKKLACETLECKEQGGLVIATINYINSLSSDLLSTLITPATLLQKTSQPMVVWSLVETLGTLMADFSLWALGSEDAYYKRKTDFFDKGDVRMTKSAESLIPFYNNNKAIFGRTTRMSNSLYPNFIWDHTPMTDTD